jgi:adenylate cyclase
VTTAAWILAAAAAALLASTITFLVLYLVSRRRLADARRELQRRQQGRRRRRGVAPVAVKTVFQTADMLINKGLGAVVRNSMEDLAGWAQVERPDLARLTADGTVVLVFSDIEGSTQANERLGDRAWVTLLERHNRVIQTRVDRHGGQVVKSQGDGFMIAFARPQDAIRFAVDAQDAFGSDRSNDDEQIRVRIGIHMGTSVRRGDDLFGLDVALAARVADQADGGEVLVSEPIRVAVPEVEYGSPRQVELKGLQGTHTLFPVA